MSVKRYGKSDYHNDFGEAWSEMQEEKIGNYVLYTDYQKLEEEVEKLKEIIEESQYAEHLKERFSQHYED